LRVKPHFTSLLVQASLALCVVEIPEWDSIAAFRRRWLVGFAFAVGERVGLAEQRCRAASDVGGGPPVALVPADRSDRVGRRVEEFYPSLRISPQRRLVGGGMAGGCGRTPCRSRSLTGLTPERRHLPH
jgi:hypothetical protein